MKSVYYLVASNQPKICCTKSVKKLIKRLGVEPNKIKIFCHNSQLQDFKDLLKHYGVEILRHDFSLCPDGKPPFGALRWYGMDLLKRRYMSNGDAGVLLDDDIIMTRYILPDAPKTKWSYGTSELSSKIYIKKLQILMQKAEAENIPYFTTSLNYRVKSSYNRVTPLMRTYKWSGFLGFFKWSENPFDRTFSVAADAEAQQNIVFHSKSLNVLQDTGLIVATDFKGRKYDIGADRDRTENYAIIDNRYPGISNLMDHNLCKTNHCILNRKVLNQLKNKSVWRLRDNEGERWMATCIKCGDEFSDNRKELGYDTCLDCGEQEAKELSQPKKERLLMRLEKENVYRRK
jgi:hypothetical protein